jgi:hypothetical protein
MESSTFDEAEPDPMLPEQFEIAVNATQIRTPELIAACKAVLVEGAVAKEIAEKLKIDDVSNVYRALKRIKRKWEKICAKEEWTCVSLALPGDVIDMAMAYERNLLKKYSEKKGKRSRRGKK